MKHLRQILTGRFIAFMELAETDAQQFSVRLFRVLALIGTVTGASMMLFSFLMGSMENGYINIFVTVVSFGIFLYAGRYRNMQVCYLATIIAVFFVLFTALYLWGGGSESGMPFFFVLALFYTLFMLKGKLAVIVFSAELLYYTGLLILHIYHPELILPLDTPMVAAQDRIVGFVASSLFLGITFMWELSLYMRQHIRLKQAVEEANQANAVKNSFLGSVSHEIRTPINVMLGMSEMIQRESIDRTTSEYARRINNAGEHLLELVSSLLELSSIEAGRMEISVHPYDPKRMLWKAVEETEARAEEKGLQLTVHTDNLPPLLTGDALNLRRIVINLVSNAIKYTHRGTVELSASYGEGMLEICVKDTGIGIRKEQMDHIFEAFTRVDRQRNQDIEGMGLGLSIVQELTNLMGGSVTADSEYGKGSTFMVSIPQEICTGSGEEPTVQALPEVVHFAEGCSVLVADDRQDNIYVLETLLSHTGIRVTGVTSGMACLEELEHAHYDLVLLDYMMPEMDGVETLYHIREKFSERQLPVIVLTADARKEARDTLIARGFTDYISKPIRSTVLEGVLARYLPVVTDSEWSEARESDPEETARVIRLLSPYNIDAERGLDLLGGDLVQYQGLADIFRQHQQLPESEDDSENLRRAFHTLKSAAGSLGAVSLQKTAAFMEGLARKDDRERLDAAWTLLEVEFRRVMEGLCLLQEEKHIEHAVEGKEKPALLLEELRQALRFCESSRAKDLASRLIDSLQSGEKPNQTEILQEIFACADRMEFARAEALADSLLL